MYKLVDPSFVQRSSPMYTRRLYEQSTPTINTSGKGTYKARVASCRDQIKFLSGSEIFIYDEDECVV